MCHHATIMRGGKVVAECNPKRETAKSMAELMIGAKLHAPKRAKAHKSPEILLRVEGLSWQPEDQFSCGLDNVALEVASGEVLGIAGIAGNGQSELMDMLTGEERAPRAEMISYKGEAIGHFDVPARRALGLCFAPEERLGHGAVPAMPLWENGLLSGFKRLGLLNRGFINVDKTIEFSNEVIKVFRVKTTGAQQAAASLSGGNLQKFVIGREILQKPDVMIALQPTWGVDAGSAAEIRQALIDLAKGGAGVVVISQDLDELFEMSTRISVISEGKLTAPKLAGSLSVEEIGLTMGGLHDLADTPPSKKAKRRGGKVHA